MRKLSLIFLSTIFLSTFSVGMISVNAVEISSSPVEENLFVEQEENLITMQPQRLVEPPWPGGPKGPLTAKDKKCIAAMGYNLAAVGRNPTWPQVIRYFGKVVKKCAF